MSFGIAGKYVKRGIELWQPAFAVLGFPNTPRAVLPGDQDWPADYAAGDIRYASVGFALSEDRVFAIGPSVVDPRRQVLDWHPSLSAALSSACVDLAKHASSTRPTLSPNSAPRHLHPSHARWRPPPPHHLTPADPPASLPRRSGEILDADVGFAQEWVRYFTAEVGTEAPKAGRRARARHGAGVARGAGRGAERGAGRGSCSASGAGGNEGAGGGGLRGAAARPAAPAHSSIHSRHGCARARAAAGEGDVLAAVAALLGGEGETVRP